MSQRNDPPRCFTCKQIITFDNEHIGKNGKKIPLDPATHQPHDCPEREKTFDEKANTRTTNHFLEQEQERPWTPNVKEVAHGIDGDGLRGQEDKDDHGNEEYASLSERNKDPLEYVDHTVARPSKVKIFHAENSDLVELAYNEFLKSKTFQWTRAQLGAKGNEFAIALYYEETK